MDWAATIQSSGFHMSLVRAATDCFLVSICRRFFTWSIVGRVATTLGRACSTCCARGARYPTEPIRSLNCRLEITLTAKAFLGLAVAVKINVTTGAVTAANRPAFFSSARRSADWASAAVACGLVIMYIPLLVCLGSPRGGRRSLGPDRGAGNSGDIARGVIARDTQPRARRRLTAKDRRLIA
jgi:hypothetical protein